MWIARETRSVSDSAMETITDGMRDDNLIEVDPCLSLVQKCLDGLPTAQRALFNHLLPSLKSAVRRYIWSETDVQDILQEAFIRIFRNLHQFDERKGKVQTWATKIAVNTAITQGKKDSKRKSLFEASHTLSEEPEVMRLLDEEALLQRLKALPKDQYEVLLLYAVDGYSHDEIAVLLDIKAVTSRKRLSRAKQWIVSRFDVEGNEMILKKNSNYEMD
jgi:RNA polymerase sigma-70 factor (ECF subfamily)